MGRSISPTEPSPRAATTITAKLSFGTHLGGGAVDLSVIQHPEWVVLWDEVDPLIRALRVSGFAAWLRDYGEIYPDSPIHIHAIAIGDAELSPGGDRAAHRTQRLFPRLHRPSE